MDFSDLIFIFVPFDFLLKNKEQKLGCAVTSLKIIMLIFCVLSNFTVIFGKLHSSLRYNLEIYLIFSEAYVSVILLKEVILKQMSLGSQMK